MATPITIDTNARVGEVSYNGFRFPPAINSSAQFTPVYDDSGRVLKYTRIEISITFLLFPGITDGSQSSFITLGSQPSYRPAPTVGSLVDGSNDPVTTDPEFISIRERLMQPGQRLAFTYQGIGSFTVQETTFDVDNGPKPQILSWKPTGGNKTCYVEWRVVTCIQNCSEGNGVYGTAQFPFTVRFGIAPNGLTVRTIVGKLESPLSRQPGLLGVAGPSSNFDFASVRLKIANVFPLLRQFTRSYDFTLTADRKYVEFTVTDSEIGSDEAYGEGCIREDVTLSTANTEEFGFAVWDTSLRGTIEVAAGYPKSYAFAEIARLFIKECLVRGVKGYKYISSETTKPQSKSPSEQDHSSVNVSHLAFSDELFGRSVSFEIRWQLLTSLETLFQATGLFQPVRDSNTAQFEAWTKWRASIGLFMANGGGFQNLQFNNLDDVIVSLCEPWQHVPRVDAQPPSDPNTRPSRKVKQDPQEVDPKYSWLQYKSKFDIEVDETTSVLAPLHPYTPGITQPSANKKLQTESTVPPQNAGSLPVRIHRRREPIYYLHFSGYAVRANYPIPEPVVVEVGGRPVTKIGKGVFKSQKIGHGSNPITGKSHMVFSAMWYYKYVIHQPPKNATISTDGHPDIYV